MVAIAKEKGHPTLAQQGAGALFYAVSSLLVIFVNKIVLTSYQFPSYNFVALSQFATTATVMWALQLAGKLKLSPLDWDTAKAVLPLTGLFLLNVLSGLGGTQRINLPMFTVLRRFSILMTMLLEVYFGMSRPSRAVCLAVGLMMGGAVVAALNDITFDGQGYTLVMFNNFFTAAYGITMKKALSGKAVSKSSLIFYNALFSSCIMVLLLAARTEEVSKIKAYAYWSQPSFCMGFMLAACMGSVLNYSIFVCTSVNSALTTTVVGCLKNVLTAYLGMLLLRSDYTFNGLNFLGLNVSIFGSLVYSHATYKESMAAKQSSAGSSSGGGSSSNGSSSSNGMSNGGAHAGSSSSGSKSSIADVSEEERGLLLGDSTLLQSNGSHFFDQSSSGVGGGNGSSSTSASSRDSRGGERESSSMWGDSSAAKARRSPKERLLPVVAASTAATSRHKDLGGFAKDMV